jgi:hypothetical protein
MRPSSSDSESPHRQLLDERSCENILRQLYATQLNTGELQILESDDGSVVVMNQLLSIWIPDPEDTDSDSEDRKTSVWLCDTVRRSTRRKLPVCLVRLKGHGLKGSPNGVKLRFLHQFLTNIDHSSVKHHFSPGLVGLCDALDQQLHEQQLQSDSHDIVGDLVGSDLEADEDAASNADETASWGEQSDAEPDADDKKEAVDTAHDAARSSRDAAAMRIATRPRQVQRHPIRRASRLRALSSRSSFGSSPAFADHKLAESAAANAESDVEPQPGASVREHVDTKMRNADMKSAAAPAWLEHDSNDASASFGSGAQDNKSEPIDPHARIRHLNHLGKYDAYCVTCQVVFEPKRLLQHSGHEHTPAVSYIEEHVVAYCIDCNAAVLETQMHSHSRHNYTDMHEKRVLSRSKRTFRGHLSDSEDDGVADSDTQSDSRKRRKVIVDESGHRGH